MTSGKVTWTSPKGYGFVELDDGRSAFAPAALLSAMERPHDGKEVLVTLYTSNDRLICQTITPKASMSSLAMECAQQAVAAGYQVLFASKEMDQSNLEERYGRILGPETLGQGDVKPSCA